MKFLEFLKLLPKYNNIVNDLLSNDYKNIYLGNAASNAEIALAALSYVEKKENIIYVTESIYEATRAYETFCDYIGIENVSFFPVEEFISSNLVASSVTFRLARMLTLNNFVEGNKKIIVTNTEGITRLMMSKGRIEQSILKIKTDSIYPMHKLIKDLINRGYKKTAITEELGTFSVRGSIVDIYPINDDNVYRIYYFDDEIEKIKKVDLETQMSVEVVKEILVFPLYDLYFDIEEFDSIREKVYKNNKKNANIEKDLENLENYNCLDQLYCYLPYIDNESIPFVSLIKPYAVFYEDINHVFEHEEVSIKEISEFYLNSHNINVKSSISSLYEVIELASKNVFGSPYICSLNNIKLSKLLYINTTSNFEYNNNIKLLMDDIKANKNKTYVITHEDNQKLNFIRETFKQNDIYTEDINKNIINDKVNIGVMSDAHGFVDLDLNLEILTPNEYSPGKIVKKSKYAKFYKNASKIYDKDELKVGDYVIHQDYGVGIYMGIKTVELRGNKNDYLMIKYDGNEDLLIPVANLYFIEKYNTSSDSIPKLNSLSNKDWNKKKEKVKKKVYEVAKKLIMVQAERETRQGYIYKQDSPDQFVFESDFPYTETKDQIEAIQQVKKDMESKKPLDRLICGDVGFGKTEVAMRASFKAVDNGKQVAYLAPTTVLTRQHYNTFKERFEKFGIRVEVLNRFVPVSKQNQIIDGLKKGYVDIVIGTHRLLGKDIAFKDLGLLIIDEEQRFGVLAKEKIKEIKSNVDVLTLSATPIPRTLQMSLSGLRDLSLIETPPNNRLPVQTFVLESNDSVIREAINRELGRGGQVFYLLNRIDELDIIEDKVKKLCPHARVTVIHGKMDKDEIENSIVRFLNKEYNVLVCTTIIETGIDIPNANTLLIECADHLGLSQLYQIRGRVGRSDRIAYAYFMYDPHKVITDNARKRLEAIKEFTSLGSGYKIAMRDLAIRGAGDILGDEQSGFIDAIGMELYMKLLNEAIDELNGKKPDLKKEEHIYNVNISKHIDSSYVSDDEIRIIMHQEICKIRSREQINALIEEYTDRYGKLSEQIILYMEEKYLEFLLKSHGIETIKEKDNTVTLNFDEESTKKLNFKLIAKVAKEIAPKFNFSYNYGKLFIEINKKDYNESYIYTLVKFFEKIPF